MMGSLHIEIASLNMIGQWLTNSGWECVLVQADITIPGGGEGCHLRVVPPGQFLRRPSTPKPFIEPGFSIFLT